MAREIITVAILGVIASLLDPLFWIGIALAKLEKDDKKNRDLHIWQRTEL